MKIDFSILPNLAMLLLLCALLVIERVTPAFSPLPSRWPHAIRNIIVGGLNAILFPVLFASLLVAAAYFSDYYNVGVLHQFSLPSWGTLMVAIVLFDCWQYGWHRLNHQLHFLWRFHRVHHSDAHMDCTTAFRFHPGEIALSFCARLFIVPVLGMTIEHLLFYQSLAIIIVLIHHANISLPPSLERSLRYIVVTPGMHKVHHSQNKIETDSNFSSVLSVWDRLFASFLVNDNINTIRLGLDTSDASNATTLVDLYSMPFSKD